MAAFFAVFCLLFIGILAYYYVQRKFTYWTGRGFPFLTPQFPYGNMKGIGKELAVGELMENFYKGLKGKAPVGGVYFFTEPAGGGGMSLSRTLTRSMIAEFT